MRKIFISITFLSLLISIEAKGQALGLNNATPAASSIFDAVATNRGILIPRMTTAQRTGIASPADGLLVYDLDLDAFYYYDATVTAGWRPLFAGGRASETSVGSATMEDGTMLNLSTINVSSTTEGLRLPQATDVSLGTAEGQIEWDSDGDLLQVGTSGGIKTIGIPNNIQIFTSSGTWTKPAGVSTVWVKVWGGGGAGITATSNSSGGGGGGGGYSEGLITVTANVTVTVGTGGATSGAAGSTTSFAGSVTIQATGGSGATTTTGGAGGEGSIGTINLTGGTGGNSVAQASAGGGTGGGSPMGGAGGSGGGGSNSTDPSILGRAGTVPGGGGGGGSESIGVFGAGAAGLVIVYY